MTKCIAQFTGAAGAGVMFGPLVGGVILKRTNSTKLVYYFKSLWCALHTMFLLKMMPEVMPIDKKRPFTGFKNPFNFLALFNKSKMLTRMVMVNTLGVFAEGKSINDLHQVWMRAQLGWTVQQAANWTSVAGSFYFLCAPITQVVMKRLGPRGFTHFAMTVGTIAYSLMGASSVLGGKAYWAGLFSYLPAVNGNSGVVVKSLATKHAILAG